MKYTVGIITLSDSGAAGQREDRSGPAIKEILENDGRFEVKEQLLISDDRAGLEAELIRLCDASKLTRIFPTARTPLSPRHTPP